MAETLDKGRYSLWQFGIYEERGPQTWRLLSRLDLGAWEGVELGVLAISPKNQAAQTWVNVQARPLKEEGWRPAVSAGVWDLFNKTNPWFKSRSAGASPFAAVSKSVKRGPRYLKGGLNYGFNRLHGWSGGAELRFLPGTGAMAEYSPKNLRLQGAAEIDFGVYQWLGKHFRVRASSMGGNPMVDAFFTYSFAGK
jgi:hypothetical protein